MNITGSMDITCSLVGADAEAQCAGWTGLGRALRRSARIDGGVRLWFDGAAQQSLRDLAAREAECCPFLDLAVTTEDDAAVLDVTSAHAEAAPVIDALGELVGAVDR
jgi:hypothetical protein